MHIDNIVEPDSAAVRTALWRAMHVLVDQPSHVSAPHLPMSHCLRIADAVRNLDEMDLRTFNSLLGDVAAANASGQGVSSHGQR